MMFIEKTRKLNTIGWLDIKIKWLLRVILFGLFLLLPVTVYTQDVTLKSTIYTVKPGDSLTRIAASYGNRNLWKSIFEANRDAIQNPDVIYTGQKLLIPHFIAENRRVSSSKEKKLSVADSPSQSKETDTDKEEDQETLNKFRKLFSQVVRQEAERKEKRDTRDDYNLSIGGLIINETRSKMGSDFYNVFYKYWQAPENAGNFILTITEQPIPSLGTLVTVKIDNQQVFKTRLQPRYAVTEKLAKQAVAVTYYSLYQQLSISSQITTY